MLFVAFIEIFLKLLSHVLNCALKIKEYYYKDQKLHKKANIT